VEGKGGGARHGAMKGKGGGKAAATGKSGKHENKKEDGAVTEQHVGRLVPQLFLEVDGPLLDDGQDDLLEDGGVANVGAVVDGGILVVLRDLADPNLEGS
jgi:hypothetical protein